MPVYSKKNIKQIQGLEILDSRGIPTLLVNVILEDGSKASASVPSGTSAGKFEAYELRDNDPQRFKGQGVQKAVKFLETTITATIKGFSVLELQKIDDALLTLDGTPDKSRLGANTILGVSLACARAGAVVSKLPLYRYIRKIYHLANDGWSLPQPMFNMLNGGRHAESGMDIQEFMLVPAAATFRESIRFASEVFIKLKENLQGQGESTSVGLEGGFAPKVTDSKQAIELLLEAGYGTGIPKKQIGIGLDVAASELYENGKYHFRREQVNFSRDQLITWYSELIKKYPVISIEDGLSEDDWEGWKIMREQLGKTIKVVGDDLTVTNPTRIKRSIVERAVNAVIIKPNQIGTLTETIASISLAKMNNISIIISHRSGDTIDDFIADLAVAVSAEFIKSGSVSRGERVAKYNRLLEIEREVNAH